jgi:hypothetical protein
VLIKLGKIMFLFKKDPTKKLRKKYIEKLEKAMNAQRSGDIRSYSLITSEAEIIHKKILELEAKNLN